MSTYVKRNGKYYNVNRKVEFETEFRETNQGMRVKCRKLGKKMRNARCVTVLTGAGIGMIEDDIETLNIPSTDTARIQECHILLGHILCGLVEESIFGSFQTKNS